MYFDVKEVSADKAYLSKKNLAAVEAIGAQAYIPFKVNSTPDHGHHKRDTLWVKAYHYYHLQREEFPGALSQAVQTWKRSST